MVTTTVLAQSAQAAGSIILRLTSATASTLASGQLSALAGGARHFSSSAPGSELKAALAAQIPSQQVGGLHCTAACAPPPWMSPPAGVPAASAEVHNHTFLCVLQERLKALKKNYGGVSLGEVTVEMCIGGMRGVPVSCG